MKIIYISAECFPAAKVGGLADVVGALPKYINRSGHIVEVIMPKYDLPWINNHSITKSLFRGQIDILSRKLSFTVEEVSKEILGFKLLLVDIPTLFDRKGVYSDETSNYFLDEPERYTTFAKAVLNFILDQKEKPDVVHCHDHHTALVPFMMTQTNEYKSLSNIPTVLTIHNEKYRGRFTWQKNYLLPKYKPESRGLLDWDHMIDPLACGIKCCWAMTTVSPSYMQELLNEDSDLNPLFQQEKKKAKGIINGIDNDFWNPETDQMLEFQLKSSTKSFKQKNKKALCGQFGLNHNHPTFSFIGRFANEKGADLIPRVVDDILSKNRKVNFIILGTGMPSLEKEFSILGEKFSKSISVHITYNEALAHKIYAGSDFVLMPSRVEPCGLNQMYAMRYGAIPVVRAIGGLKDTVIDISRKNGCGIQFAEANTTDLEEAIHRSLNLFKDQTKHQETVQSAVKKDFSWDASAKNYIKLYRELLKRKTD